MEIIIKLNELVLCPFQAFLDLAEQLDETTDELKSLVFKPVRDLNKISDWVLIDDSLGDLSTLRGFEICQKITALLANKNITSLTIHIDLGQYALTSDNVFALLYLAESIDTLSLFFYVSPQKTIELREQTLLLQQKSNTTIYYRATDTLATLKQIKPIEERLNLKRHQCLNAHGFSFYNTLETTPSPLGSLIGYGWSCLKSGAYQLGCQVFESFLALDHLDSNAREELLVHLQIIRFLSHQHHQINAQLFPEPFRFISNERIEHLYFIRAFAATLTRQLGMAEALFKEANIGLETPMTDEESVYKLNLYALFLLVKGEADTAFSLEKQLHAYLQAHYKEAHVLTHVILMNLARLYKKSKQYDLAQQFYEQAYGQLRAGEYTVYDQMNNDIDAAILCEARGQIAKALDYWTKVAQAWQSNPNPYSLPVRTRLVLCQEKVTDCVKPVAKEKVNAFLINKITNYQVNAHAEA